MIVIMIIMMKVSDDDGDRSNQYNGTVAIDNRCFEDEINDLK